VSQEASSLFSIRVCPRSSTDRTPRGQWVHQWLHKATTGQTEITAFTNMN